MDNDINVEMVTALMFQIQGVEPTNDLWDSTKREAIKYIEEHGGFPSTFKMPCNNELIFNTPEEIMSLPIKDIPCPCGDKTHWLVRFRF